METFGAAFIQFSASCPSLFVVVGSRSEHALQNAFHYEGRTRPYVWSTRRFTRLINRRQAVGHVSPGNGSLSVFKLWSITGSMAAALVLLYFSLSEVNLSTQTFGPLRCEEMHWSLNTTSDALAPIAHNSIKTVIQFSSALCITWLMLTVLILRTQVWGRITKHWEDRTHLKPVLPQDNSSLETGLIIRVKGADVLFMFFGFDSCVEVCLIFRLYTELQISRIHWYPSTIWWMELILMGLPENIQISSGVWIYDKSCLRGFHILQGGESSALFAGIQPLF